MTWDPRWSHSETWREISVSWLIRFSICCGSEDQPLPG